MIEIQGGTDAATGLLPELKENIRFGADDRIDQSPAT
jgi:hypothetical protein